MNILKELTPARLKITLIAAPMTAMALYYGVLAADRYVSESTVALRQSGQGASSLAGAAMLLSALNPPAHEDTLYVKQYIHSLALLKELDAKLKLRDHYSAERRDFIERLPADAAQEDFLEYYRSRVEVSMDELSSTLTVRAQGFDPDYAQRLNEAILTSCETFVNELTHKLAREKLGFAESELARAAAQLQQARTEVLAFQAKHKVLDATVQAEASGAVISELQGTITKLEAELRTLRSYLNDDANQVKALRGQIEAVRAQLDLERLRATSATGRGDRVGALAIEFEGLRMKAEFALDAYKLALSAVETARVDTTRKLSSLAVIEPATRPELAELPRRLYNLTTLLVVCALIYGVVRLVLATIREHQD
jgi:capsular polysaccharide transport system permease protein